MRKWSSNSASSTHLAGGGGCCVGACLLVLGRAAGGWALWGVRRGFRSLPPTPLVDFPPPLNTPAQPRAHQ